MKYLLTQAILAVILFAIYLLIGCDEGDEYDKFRDDK